MAFFQSDNLCVNQHAEGVADLVLDVPGSKVNLLSRPVLVDLAQALDRVADEGSIGLLVVRTAKPASFCAGLAPAVLANMTPTDFSDMAALGQQLFDKLARLRVPTIAKVSGACLGGGLELALACDYRVAVNRPSTIFGFTDLEVGLMPMWGGTQRLPKVVGLERGLLMLLGARRAAVREAQTWGLVDEVTEGGDPIPPAFLQRAQKKPLRFLPLRTLRQRLTESTRLGRWLILRGAERLLRNRLPDDMAAPWQALDAVRTGLRAGVEEQLERERLAARQLAESEAFRNLVHLQVERDKFRVRQGSGRPKAIGIVGGGSRGADFVSMAVAKGYRVVLREAGDAALGYALFRVMTTLQQEVSRGTMSQANLVKNLGNIQGTTTWTGFNDVDLVLEAIVEDPVKKKALFRELERKTDAGALLVSTGSSVRVTELQEGLQHPERIGGLHFSTPVARSLLVEVVASDRTATDVTRRLIDFVASLGRAPQPVKDEPGLLLERILFPYFNEAILLVKEGFSPPRVDEAMVRFGMIHGPLEHLDLMGLDVAAPLAETLSPVLEQRLAIDETFDFMEQQGWLGQKSGLGFYRYRGKRKIVHHTLVAHLRAASHVEAPHQMDAVSKADQRARARKRLVRLMINEAAWCLEEGRAETPEALDLALMLAGWAPHRGGPLHYARHLGIDTVIRELAELAAEHGPRYVPCPRLGSL